MPNPPDRRQPSCPLRCQYRSGTQRGGHHEADTFLDARSSIFHELREDYGAEDARHARLSRVLAVDEEGAEGDRQQDGGDAQEREGNGPDKQDSAEPGSRARVLGLRAKEAALHQECAAAQSSGRLDAVRSESCAVHR